MRHFFAQLLGQWAKLIALRALTTLGWGWLALMSLLGCATEPIAESKSRVRLEVPPGLAKLVVIGTGVDSDSRVLDEIGRQRRPSSVLIQPDDPTATTTWIDPAPMSSLSAVEGTALTTPVLARTHRVVAMTRSARTLEGILELASQRGQPALEVLAERGLLDELLIDPRIASAIGADRVRFRAIEPGRRIELGDGTAISLLRIGADVACRIDGPKRRILYAPRIENPEAPGWIAAIQDSDLQLLDARLDPATVAAATRKPPPAVPAVAHRVRGFRAGSARFLSLDSRFGVADQRFVGEFRTRGFEIAFEGDEYWL